MNPHLKANKNQGRPVIPSDCFDKINRACWIVFIKSILINCKISRPIQLLRA